MPVLANISVSREISTLTFNSDDTVVITMNVTENNGITGNILTGTESYIAPAIAVQPILDAPSPAGYTVRDTLCAAVYNYLISNSLIPGALEE